MIYNYENVDPNNYIHTKNETSTIKPFDLEEITAKIRDSNNLLYLNLLKTALFSLVILDKKEKRYNKNHA